MGIKNSRGSKGVKLIKKRLSEKFYLWGLLRSSKQHKYTAAASKGNGGKYGYYFCHNRDCGNYKAETVHQQFLELLDTIQPAREDIDLYFELFTEKILSTYKHKAEEEKRLFFVIDSLKQKRVSLMDMRLNREITGSDFIEQRNRLDAEILDIENQRSTIQKSNTEWKDVLDYGKGYITDIRDRCESLNAVEKKIAYIGSIFPFGLVYNGQFLSNQQTLEVITACNGQNRLFVTPQGIEP